ncbi:TonB-dependent receptor domain-containing protein [Asaia lannensis]|uniref:TonB-dependent receptor n=1 Tax=Asaia lannensis NBRC 102526 TaxID=1307926 RepID=A0ABT1CF91_9PROT|nr:TonB-dependent receptor [Asaia lannensis]MCO6159411.1 TonB-dependent receptor [Asaia lannensis NBRC 102526]GBQ98236.1 TonB-dependent receptor protein [Asaia lannensis NBRC 102526]
MAISRIRLRRASMLLGATVLAGVSVSARAETNATIHHKPAHKSSAKRATQAQTTQGRPAQARTATTGAAAAPAALVTPVTTRSRSLRSLSDAAPAGNESITVVGSALSTSNNTNANPVQIITAKQIAQTGVNNLSDFFSRLPSVGSSATTNAVTNGGGGVSCTDLRNLGTNRVLVLIDGKRTTINGNSNCVDLNSIPLQQVAGVEILKDGGSELYGADAVSGVINIKMRHDVNTGNITMRGSISQYGDAPEGMLSAFKGWNFDHGRGNITLFGQYLTSTGVMQRNRAWANPVALTNPVSGQPSYGSSYSTNGTFYPGNDPYTTHDNGQTVVPFTKSDRYPFNRDSSLTNNYQDSSLSGDTHYDVNKHLTVYANVLYSHRTTNSFMAPEPMSGSIPPSTLPSTVVVPGDYPGNPFGEDTTVYRRMGEWGPRRYERATDTVTGMFGAKGEITHGWMYDASYTYGVNRENVRSLNIGNYANLLNAWGLRAEDPGNPDTALVYDPSVCQASAGCELSSPFGKLTPQGAAYSNYTTVQNIQYQFRDTNFRVHNNHVVSMPWKNGGDLGIALGMEHRSEQMSDSPDPLVAQGVTLTNTQAYTGGGFNVSEGYLEGKLNLLKNAFLAKDLTIDAQGRYSSYNTFGAAKNWKVAINWAPNRDIRFRGTLGTSYRQPNIFELFGGQQLSYETAYDPCSQVGTYGAASATVAATCARQGIGPGFEMRNAAQVPTLQGGNSQVKPETGRTYTFGTVLTPHWVPGLSLSVEYWHYTLKNMISAIGTQYLLDQCYTGANTSYCGNIVRNAQTQQIQTASALYENLGGLHTSGLDFDLDYSLRLTRHDRLNLSNNFQQLISYQQQYVPGGQWYNYDGRLLYNNSTGQPRVRDYATATWRHDDFSFTYMMSYTGGMIWNDQSVDLVKGTVGRYKTPGIFSHDITLGYQLNRWQFQAGVRNLFDKKPPYVVDGATNTNVFQYGNLIMGRNVFVQAGVNF